MLNAQPTLFLLDAIETAIAGLATGTPPSVWKVGLFTGTPTLSEDTVLSDLTEPAFTGYARVAMTPGTIRRDAAGNVILPLGKASFQPTADPVGTITVTGVFVVIDTDLIVAEFLDAPWLVVNTGSAIDIIEEIYVTNGSYYGGVCTTCRS